MILNSNDGQCSYTAPALIRVANNNGNSDTSSCQVVGPPRSCSGPSIDVLASSLAKATMDEGMEIVDDDPSSEAMDIGGGGVRDGGLQSEGKKFQKESNFLKLLPYYADLQEETEELLDKTIRNLAKAVLCQDFQVGGILYTKALWTYIYLYGRKFTKEQHVRLIKLYLEMLTMKTCPLNAIANVADMLNCLLRKPELLTRDDIVIPWRPLYETLDRCVFHRKYALSFKASAFPFGHLALLACGSVGRCRCGPVPVLYHQASGRPAVRPAVKGPLTTTSFLCLPIVFTMYRSRVCFAFA